MFARYSLGNQFINANMSMYRRDFLKNTFFCSGLFLAPKLLAAKEQPAQYELIARPSLYKFTPNSKASNLWLYNDSSPGPTLTVQKGQELIVKVLNLLEEPTSIHWHGIRNVNHMDGVPDLTQNPIEPGENFTYRFTAKDAGTFWYHAHSKAWEQVARGLYGALIVKTHNRKMSARDIVLLADDWRLNKNFALDESTFKNLHDWSHRGRLGNWLTINGKSKPEIILPNNGRVRFRLINTTNARKLIFQFGDKQELRVISLDGAPCKPFSAKTITLAPGQRTDISVAVRKSLDAIYEVSSRQKIIAARFSQSPNIDHNSNTDIVDEVEPWYPFPPQEDAKIVEIHMQGGAMGNLSSAIFEGEERPLRELAVNSSKIWAFNGAIGGYGLELASVSLGETVVLRIWNDTRFEHSMHLHGHHFWVRSKEFDGAPKTVLRDTYLMAPGEQAYFTFIADNPGLWLLHCHMLEHHAAGMGGLIKVT